MSAKVPRRRPGKGAGEQGDLRAFRWRHTIDCERKGRSPAILDPGTLAGDAAFNAVGCNET
jgi:hypothetical protein